MDLDALADVARGLLRTAPADFVTERTTRQRAARSEDRELATAIGRLRKPAPAAWVVDLLAADGALDDAAALGPTLRAAQDRADPVEIAALRKERASIVRAAVERGVALADDAGHPVTPAVLDQVRSTIEAVTSDPHAAAAARSGLLVRPLEHAGFDDVDLDGALAVPDAVPDAWSGTDAPPVSITAGRRGARRSRTPGRPGRASPGTAREAGQSDEADTGSAQRPGVPDEADTASARRPGLADEADTGTARRSGPPDGTERGSTPDVRGARRVGRASRPDPDPTDQPRSTATADRAAERDAERTRARQAEAAARTASREADAALDAAEADLTDVEDRRAALDRRERELRAELERIAEDRADLDGEVARTRTVRDDAERTSDEARAAFTAARTARRHSR